MTDHNRIDPLLAKLRTYWLAHPDLRLGQIISNFSPMGRGPFYIEDSEVLACLDARLAAMPRPEPLEKIEGLPPKTNMSNEFAMDRDCPSEHCFFCTGEACKLCGAGCWDVVSRPSPGRPRCEHDVTERHTERLCLRNARCLSDPALDGAQWLPRETPQDPFAGGEG